MARYIDIDGFRKNAYYADTDLDIGVYLAEHGYADVAPRAEVFEEVDKFRADLMDKFIDLCRGNDYNKLTLLKIGDVVDEIYDRLVAELKNKYAEGRNESPKKS